MVVKGKPPKLQKWEKQGRRERETEDMEENVDASEFSYNLGFPVFGK